MAPDFLGLRHFQSCLPLSEHLQDLHGQMTKLIESGNVDGEHLRKWLIAFEMALCARVTQAVEQEERIMLLEAQRPRAFAWMRWRNRSDR
jgi:hypothetical protein